MGVLKFWELLMVYRLFRWGGISSPLCSCPSVTLLLELKLLRLLLDDLRSSSSSKREMGVGLISMLSLSWNRTWLWGFWWLWLNCFFPKDESFLKELFVLYEELRGFYSLLWCCLRSRAITVNARLWVWLCSARISSIGWGDGYILSGEVIVLLTSLDTIASMLV